MSVRLVTCLLCEDIRQELTGKFIFVGAYPPVFDAAVNPTLIQIQFVLMFTTDGTGEAIELKFSGGGYDSLYLIRVERGDLSPIIHSPIGVPVNGPRELILEWRAGEEWNHAATWKIGVNEETVSAPEEQAVFVRSLIEAAKNASGKVTELTRDGHQPEAQAQAS